MQRTIQMLALVIAGELVFGLVFNIPRFFRPTMLEVFQFSNTELGDLFAVYGVMAMIAYFPGGAIADRYSARALIAISLIATALGGLYMATLPPAFGMQVLFAYWGLTTIFLFWGALIRATREWGGDRSQGVAFGLMEGGRGVVAASVAATGVLLLAIAMPADAGLATDAERESGFRLVVLFYSLLTFLAGAFAWFAIPKEKLASDVEYDPLKGMGAVLRRPVVWAQAGIVVFAYCCFKGLDNSSLYAAQVLGMNDVEAARIASYGAWIRPVAAVAAGVLADRFNATSSIGWMFVMLAATFGIWSLAEPTGIGSMTFYLNAVVAYVGVFALRGVYFALLEENRTPKYLTGAAVGLVSLVGYTPDVFFGPISGRILDASPGLAGHQNYYLFLASIAVAGLLMVGWLVLLRRRGIERLWPGSSS